MLAEITPVLLTQNEAENIGRTLCRLTWAKRIIIVDSGSTDKTLEIAGEFPQVQIFQRRFDTHAQQWQFATDETGIRTSWLLRLDADYEVTDALVTEISRLDVETPVSAYRVRFEFAIFSHKLRASLYPPKTVLLRCGQFSIVDAGHTERWVVHGLIQDLHGCIVHDDRKPLSHWLGSQRRYAELEANHLLQSDPRDLKRTDRVRRMSWPAPLGVLFYVLICKGCILDGWPGWYYALQRLLAETMIAIELINRRLRHTVQEACPVPSHGKTPQ
jgi:glycosyltransferase involved in cell wall biosynthesis